jgi:hypothetical protein
LRSPEVLVEGLRSCKLEGRRANDRFSPPRRAGQTASRRTLQWLWRLLRRPALSRRPAILLSPAQAAALPCPALPCPALTCPDLTWQPEARRYVCGLLLQPRRHIRWLPRWLEQPLQRVLYRSIAAGKGCDCEIELE